MNAQYSRYYIFIRPILRHPIVKTYGSFIFSLVTITVFALFAIRPTFATIVSLQKSIHEQQQILDQLDSKSKNLLLGRKNFENLSHDTQIKLFTLLPDSTNIPKLIDNLSFLASKNEASISGLQFQPVSLIGASKILSKEAKLEDVEFTLNTQGSYLKLVNLLNSLAASGRLTNIHSMNFSKSEGGSLILSLNATAYFLTGPSK